MGDTKGHTVPVCAAQACQSWQGLWGRHTGQHLLRRSPGSTTQQQHSSSTGSDGFVCASLCGYNQLKTTLDGPCAVW